MVELKKVKRDRFKSKYLDLDFDKISDEEFDIISKKVYAEIGFRSVGGMILLIVGLIGVVLGGQYLW